MTELDIDISYGTVYAVGFSTATVQNPVIAGPGKLMGWSVRESGFEASQQAEGTAVAPLAGATIAQVAAPQGGIYTISWAVQLIGPAAAADQDNFALFLGATQIATALNQPVAGNYQQEEINVSDLFGSAIAVKNIGAGTAGVTYGAQIFITPTVSPQAIMELDDGNNIIAELSLRANDAASEWFGDDGIWIRNQVKVNSIQGIILGALYFKYVRP